MSKFGAHCVCTTQVERMDLNVAKWQMDSRVKLRVIGKSLDGRDINLLQIGKRTAALSTDAVILDAGFEASGDAESGWPGKTQQNWARPPQLRARCLPSESAA